MTQMKSFLFVLVISFVLVMYAEDGFFYKDILLKAHTTFLGLNLLLEIFIFFALSTFVVFGIKGIFERYSQKTTNHIIVLSGAVLILVLVVLWYQIYI